MKQSFPEKETCIQHGIKPSIISEGNRNGETMILAHPPLAFSQCQAYQFQFSQQLTS